MLWFRTERHREKGVSVWIAVDEDHFIPSIFLYNLSAHVVLQTSVFYSLTKDGRMNGHCGY